MMMVDGLVMMMGGLVCFESAVFNSWKGVV